MRNIIIVGSGAVAAELTSYIDDNNKHSRESEKLQILGYLDSEENKSKYWIKYKFKNPILSDIQSYVPKPDDHFIIGISDLDFRNQMIDILRGKDADITSFIHHSVLIAESATLGIGSIIYPQCIIGPNAILGDYNLITSYSFISHDCKIGNNNFLATAGISGNVSVGSNNFFGIRSTVLPSISIGNRNTIQAGMIVDKDLESNCIFFHRFREKVISIGQVKTGE